MKRGEWYRLGIQFQDSHGKWTDPIYVGDRKMQTYPHNNKGISHHGTSQAG